MFSRVWLWIWRKMNGAKLAAVLGTIAGYGVGYAQTLWPLGVPTGLVPPLPQYIPWEPMLQILAILGVSIGAGHKVIKSRRRRQTNKPEKDGEK